MKEKNLDILMRMLNEIELDDDAADMIDKIGSTIVGVKPATLINIRSEKTFSLCVWLCGKINSLGYEVISKHLDGGKVFIYHKESLKASLSGDDASKLLSFLGYAEDSCIEEKVEIMADRLKGDKFPHEIGLFFGYPAKDVWGFMGAPIPYRKTKGWRIYGDVDSSEKTYDRFMEARNYVRTAVKQHC